MSSVLLNEHLASTVDFRRKRSFHGIQEKERGKANERLVRRKRPRQRATTERKGNEGGNTKPRGANGDHDSVLWKKPLAFIEERGNGKVGAAVAKEKSNLEELRKSEREKYFEVQRNVAQKLRKDWTNTNRILMGQEQTRSSNDSDTSSDDDDDEDLDEQRLLRRINGIV